jgi:hypothetical protein
MAHQRASLSAGLLSSYVDPGKRMNESKNVQEPHNHADHHNSIQDGLDRSCHRYEVIDQPKQNTDRDKNH